MVLLGRIVDTVYKQQGMSADTQVMASLGAEVYPGLLHLGLSSLLPWREEQVEVAAWIIPVQL
jgi:hypothetical protein